MEISDIGEFAVLNLHPISGVIIAIKVFDYFRWLIKARHEPTYRYLLEIVLEYTYLDKYSTNVNFCNKSIFIKFN